jgi:hypothetical protein
MSLSKFKMSSLLSKQETPVKKTKKAIKKAVKKTAKKKK